MEGSEFEISELDELERIVGDPTAKAKRLSLSLLRDITDDFSDECIVGRGGFGVVYKGLLPNGLVIAVRKMAYMPGLDGNEFENEVRTLMKVAHKNIVRFIGYCSHTIHEYVQHEGIYVLTESSQRLICMEYMVNGSLDKHIHADNFQGGLGWNLRFQILTGICHGLRHLHNEVDIIHGDIKPENILLDENFKPKITDFGLSRLLGGSSLIITNELMGTRGYMAPEFIDKGILSFKADIFSLGVTIMNLLIGQRWDREQTFEQVLTNLKKRLVKDGVFSLWENNYQQIRTCLEIGYNCVDMDYRERPTAVEIIHRLEETESPDYSSSSGPPTLWQSGDEESNLSDTDTIEQEPEPDSTAEYPPSDEELADIDTNGETSTQEHDKLDTISKLPTSADLSKLTFLKDITDKFSYKRIVGKDGMYRPGSHKVFVYKGDVPGQKMVAVKRLIGVEIPVNKFRMEAEHFKSLDHKNIVKVVSYCHDESRKERLVEFKGQEKLVVFDGHEQLLCYEYMLNGSLHDYLVGQGSRKLDWQMRYKLIKGTCKGLRYLHQDHGNGPIVHLNLCPSNVLLDENNAPCITGFDFSKLIGEKENRSIAVKKDGQISYLPPDFFHFRGTDFKYLATVDVYSLGLMILEITTRQEINGKHEMLIKSIEENWSEESQLQSLYPSLESENLWQVKLCIDIGLHCVKPKPKERPTARKILTWLNEGKKLVPVPRAGPGGVPTPPVRTNITEAHDHIQGIPIPQLSSLNSFF